jgi:CHAT domain-containing protein
MLNFETLVVPGQTPRYWIEDVVLSSASSLQLLGRGAGANAAAPKMLIVGNPPPADAAFPPLKKAGEEIQRVQKQFAGRATVLAGSRATPAEYVAAKPQAFDYVHFVAHGIASQARPLDSAVILGPDKDRNYRLVARKIADTPLSARLVTISSCYGAGSATYAGEGLVGLAWAFLHAGADQVVAALWAVNDTAAPKLMEAMYAGLRGGKEPAVALRDAKLRLLRSRTAHQQPMFWAPFVVYL